MRLGNAIERNVIPMAFHAELGERPIVGFGRI